MAEQASDTIPHHTCLHASNETLTSHKRPQRSLSASRPGYSLVRCTNLSLLFPCHHQHIHQNPNETSQVPSLSTPPSLSLSPSLPLSLSPSLPLSLSPSLPPSHPLPLPASFTHPLYLSPSFQQYAIRQQPQHVPSAIAPTSNPTPHSFTSTPPPTDPIINLTARIISALSNPHLVPRVHRASTTTWPSAPIPNSRRRPPRPAAAAPPTLAYHDTILAM